MAYVGTCQIDQLGIQDQNWSPISGGSAGRQLFAKFGRTAATQLVAALGRHALQLAADTREPAPAERISDQRQLHSRKVGRSGGGSQ